jgi:hypothetical protein
MITKTMSTCHRNIGVHVKKQQNVVKYKSYGSHKIGIIKNQSEDKSVDSTTSYTTTTSETCCAPGVSNNKPLHDVDVVQSSKKVWFAPMADVVRISNITEEETTERWYSNKEYQKFEYDRRRTVYAFRLAKENKSIYLSRQRYSSVGLEHQLSYEKQCQRRFHIMRHSYYVLKQQYYQKCKGKCDPETLQAISQMFSQNMGDGDDIRMDPYCATSIEKWDENKEGNKRMMLQPNGGII